MFKSMMANPKYTLEDVPGKGKGLVAVANILKGARILSETPIITIPERVLEQKRAEKLICQQIDALSEDQRQAFFALPNIHPYSNTAEQYFGIFKTVGLPIQDDGMASGVFLEACRINHACDNNAQKHWNRNTKQHTVHALRDIPKGEEISIYYLGRDMGREARQKALQSKFKFTCTCRLCSLPEEQSNESDKRLEELAQLDDLIGEGGMAGILSSPLQKLHYADQRVRLYNEQGPGDSGLPRVFLDAAQIAIMHGDLARGRILMERAVSGWRTAQGDDSPEVMRFEHLVLDPSKHELYGISRKWKRAVDDVPHDLGPSGFEDWLWKREGPKQKLRSRQPTNLRDHITFPGFEDLPREYENDPEYYENSGRNSNRPRRHWCFLGEIEEFGMLLRLQMDLRGIDGSVIPLFFYTDGRGNELPPASIKKGFTVAILYAEQHAFAFSPPGIRHEDPPLLKIFPHSLDELLALNDIVQEFSTELEGLRKCHGCDKKSASLQKCGKCKLFWYCGQNCQRTGWKEKCHKDSCKLFRDRDLKGLFLYAWDVYHHRLQFPLPLLED
jgi:hypothetical protein